MGYSDIPLPYRMPILVIDANRAAAWHLAHQLTDAGYQAEAAGDHPAALGAVRSRYYGSIIFVGDLDQPATLQRVAELRRRVPRTWIIAISSTAMVDTPVSLRQQVDAVLRTPYSVDDLISRLSAFSQTSRPQ